MNPKEERPHARGFRFLHYYLLYIAACVIWQGMLIAMLVAWAIQGKPDRYWFMSFTTTMDPVYLSDLGATSLKPLFAVCSGVHGALVVGAMVAEYVMRRSPARLLTPYISKHQKNMKFASIFTVTVSELGILFTACFDVDHYNHVHFSMVAIFIIFMLFTIVMDIVIYLMFWIHYRKANAARENAFYKWNCLGKCLWLVAAATCVLGFVIAMSENRDSLSGRFEWAICFWYGLLLLIWLSDIFPAAMAKRRAKFEFDFEPKPDMDSSTTEVST